MRKGTSAIAAAGCLVLVAIAQARDESEDQWWTPPGDVDRGELETLTELELAYASLAWKTFIALNWPAETKDDVPYPAPDTDKDLGYGTGEYPTVWEAWPNAQELFKSDGTTPAPWGSAHSLPSICTASGAKAGEPILQSVSKGGDVQSEFVQAFRMGPVIDQNLAYTWFGIHANEAMYDYIVDNRLYNSEGQTAFGKDADWPRGRPDSAGTEEDIGSIFVKAAWKVLGDDDVSDTFHRVDSWLYNPGDEDDGIAPSCRLKTVGLVGFHIVHRTYSAPQWTWATFEHEANAPTYAEVLSGNPPKGHYSYFDLDCVKSGCALNQLPDHPWNADAASREPVQVVRTGVQSPVVDIVNWLYRFEAAGTNPVPGTVWQSYFLVGVQFPTVLGEPSPEGIHPVNPAYPNGEPSSRFLANALIETFIQGFASVDEETTNGNRIPLQDSGIAGGGAERMTSSCVGCHGDATQTTGLDANYVYMLNRAQSAGESRVRKDESHE